MIIIHITVTVFHFHEHCYCYDHHYHHCLHPLLLLIFVTRDIISVVLFIIVIIISFPLLYQFLQSRFIPVDVQVSYKPYQGGQTRYLDAQGQKQDIHSLLPREQYLISVTPYTTHQLGDTGRDVLVSTLSNEGLQPANVSAVALNSSVSVALFVSFGTHFCKHGTVCQLWCSALL